MKTYPIILIVFVFFSLVENLQAQTNTSTIFKTDTIIPAKDNLSLLIDRIYLAFKEYRTGANQFREDIEKKEIETDEHLHLDSIKELFEKNGILDINPYKEKPIRVAVIQENTEDNKQVAMSDQELNGIPPKSIYSIEILFNPVVATALYGIGGTHQIVIRLKD